MFASSNLICCLYLSKQTRYSWARLYITFSRACFLGSYIFVETIHILSLNHLKTFHFKEPLLVNYTSGGFLAVTVFCRGEFKNLDTGRICHKLWLHWYYINCSTKTLANLSILTAKPEPAVDWRDSQNWEGGKEIKEAGGKEVPHVELSWQNRTKTSWHSYTHPLKSIATFQLYDKAYINIKICHLLLDKMPTLVWPPLTLYN